jgi:mono/diheme cytochrome c family protein
MRQPAVSPRRGFGPPASAATTSAPRRDPLAGLSPADVAARLERGRRLYAASGCAACHDTASPPAGVVPKPLLDLPARYDVASLARYLATPNPPRPAYPMSDA